MKKFSSPRDSLKLEQFDYPLPKEKIALYPLADRAAAKMLVVVPPKADKLHVYKIGK